MDAGISETLADEPFVVAFETADQTMAPLAESLLRDADIPFYWRDVGLSAGRQGGGYQLFGAALYQLLVSEPDAADTEAILRELTIASVETDSPAEPETDGPPVAAKRKLVARWAILLYLTGVGIWICAIVALLVVGLISLIIHLLNK
jgi:hypothetical protein